MAPNNKVGNSDEPVTSLTQLLDAIEVKKKSLGLRKGEECFYRGHSSNVWPLLPTLLRHSNGHVDYSKKVPRYKMSKGKLQELESDLFFEFQSRARELHQQNLDDWEILFFMRHHGVATRLLDWSEVLGVALHFATGTIKEDVSPCIWILNPYLLNVHEDSWLSRELISPIYLYDDDHDDYSDYLVSDKFEFGWKLPVALYPIQRSARLHAQRGYFTIHGNDRRPLEILYPDAVARVDISHEALPEINKFLEVAGINEYLLFPDLDSLRNDLHRKYGIS